MRIIKLAILSFIVLFLLITTISLFIPSHIRISKATNVEQDDQILNLYIGKLPEWRKWHPAFKEIPGDEFIFSGDSTIKVRGTTISVITRNEELVIMEIRKDGGRPVISGFRVLRGADSATLQWYMDFKLSWYPWEKFKSLFYENFYGVQMEQGLSNLKVLAESAVRK